LCLEYEKETEKGSVVEYSKKKNKINNNRKIYKQQTPLPIFVVVFHVFQSKRNKNRQKKNTFL